MAIVFRMRADNSVAGAQDKMISKAPHSRLFLGPDVAFVPSYDPGPKRAGLVLPTIVGGLANVGY